MREILFLSCLIYFLVISIITIIITIIDKKRAIKHRYRVSEATLITLGFLGGAVAEYITMKTIRHKTLHKKFMIGLPAIIVFHLICIGTSLYFILA